MDDKLIKILYETRYGSHAYGLNTAESDEDFKGFAVVPKEYYLGVSKHFDQREWKVPDRVIYNLPKFLFLAANCNPSIIETLFTDEEDIITITKNGKKVRENRDLFVTKKARYTFTGYAFAQLKRIRTHRHWLLNPVEKKPERKDFGLPEKKLISTDHQGAFLYVVSNILKDTLEEVKLSQTTLDELRNVNWHGLCQSSIPKDNIIWDKIKKDTGASDNFIEAMMREKAYINAINNYNSYKNWEKNRNPKRAILEQKIGYDAKHASHLIRLGRMGEEILLGKGVIVKRPDREELLAIKKGAWKYEEIEEWAKDLDKRMDKHYKESKLPRGPDMNTIDCLCLDILDLEFYGNSKIIKGEK